MSSAPVHEHWSSRFAFVMAAVGSAVGLGNFWRFPYVAGENGGAAFVLFYLVVVVLIALPVLMTEYAIGRRTQLSGVNATIAFAKESGRSSLWGIVGWVGMIAGFLILTYYSVIAGQVMAYVPLFLSGVMTNISFDQAAALYDVLPADHEICVADPQSVRCVGQGLVDDPMRLVIWHSLFMVITIGIVARGLNAGIELVSKILMPAFFIMLFGMVIYGAVIGDFLGAVDYLFRPRWSELTLDGAVTAVGQAFFSVGVGSAILITYGSYLERQTKIPSASVTVAASDTAVARLAGLAIFPLVIFIGLGAAGGPGLLFQTLPAAIGSLPGATIVGALFFLLAFFAALTSAISLFEVVVAYIVEKTEGSRLLISILAGLLVWSVGLGSALSSNVLSDFYPLNFGPFAEQTIFGMLDVLTGNIMLPLSGLLIAIFGGWVVSQPLMQEELGLSDGLFLVYQILMRFLAPLIIVGLLVMNNLSWIIGGS